MAMLIRRITLSKWMDFITHESGLTDVGGDAVTGCLKTSRNALSVWKIHNDGEIDDAILALITGAQQEKLSKINFVLINETELNKYGFSLSEMPGDTAVTDLVNSHFNITGITYSKLGIIKDIIHKHIQPENQRTVKQLQEILKYALDRKRINIGGLSTKYIEKEFKIFEPYVDRTETHKIESSFKAK